MHQGNILSSPQGNMRLTVESSQGNMRLTGEKVRFPCGERKIFPPVMAMATRRTALVSVRNNTSGPLVGVSVVHKYSNNYKHQRQWGFIQPGEIPSDSLEVEYNTGFFTTGRDWWFITWYSTDMKTLYYSNPNNFRYIFDILERIAPGAITDAAEAIAASLAGDAAADLARVAAEVTTSALFNSASTAGFKQHILRAADEGALTEIVVNADLTITFKSKSGNSDTGSASKPAPGA